MSGKERRGRDKENLRKKIMHEASLLISKYGYQKLTIRGLAEKVEQEFQR